MKIRAIILSALILCGISAVIMYSRASTKKFCYHASYKR
jgi:hypothetical protein